MNQVKKLIDQCVTNKRVTSAALFFMRVLFRIRLFVSRMLQTGFNTVEGDFYLGMESKME